MSSSGVFPLRAPGETEPVTAHALSDDTRNAYLGRARIKDVEAKLDTIQGLVQRLVEGSKQRSQDIVTRRKRHKRDSKLTAEAIRRAKRLSDVEAVIRAGQRSRAVEGIDTRSVSPTQDFSPVQAFQDFAAFVPYLPPELLQEIPWTPFVYSLRHMYMPAKVHKSLSWLISDHDARNREYQELMHAYLHLTAARLADATPCYTDIWHSYVPSMAFGANGSLGLLNALCAFAALHIAPLQTEPEKGKERALGLYITALRHHHSDENLFAAQLDDAVLATALIFAHYEVWNCEIAKMGLHMLGSKKIIMQRGMAQSQTPIGRALFSFFIRTDMQTSVVTGNPVFLDETWWKNDPLYHIPIPADAPILLAADAALTKLSVIIAKLTHLKRSVAMRRKRFLTKLQKNEIPSAKDPQIQFAKMEEQIRKQVHEMQRELEAWHRSLPVWFGSLHSDQMAEGEEDINQTDLVEIRAQRYPHHSIAVVLTCAFATNIQLWRIENPETQDPPPRIGALVHALLRAFLATPQTADSITISNVWIAALFLRNKYHRDWLEAQIRRRIQDTDFFCWKFAYHGILHEWATLDGKEEGRFKSMPKGAQEVVPGVSENLWHADGVMNTKLSDLTKEDEEAGSPEGQKPIYRFTGDSKLFPAKDANDSDEEQDPSEHTTEPETPDPGKRIPLYSSFVDDY